MSKTRQSARATRSGRGTGTGKARPSAGQSRLVPIVALLALVGALGAGFLLAQRQAGTSVASPTQVPTAAVGGPAPVAGQGQLAGQPAPPIQGQLFDGTPARLADYAGKPVMVNFWATWCPPCRLEMPWLEAAYGQHKADGLVVLAVNAGERLNADLTHQTIQRFVSDKALTLPILLPGNPDQAQAAYGVTALPSTFMVDRSGAVVDVMTGAFPSAAAVEAAAQRVLAPAGSAP
jgi:cytochrome c biogenesis protein CcmG, thiol:disulfide interchange protein DsbE